VTDAPRRPRVLLVDPIDPRAVARLSRGVDVFELQPRTTPALLEALAEVDGAIVRTTPLPRAVLAGAPLLRVVAKHGVGVDAIDLAYATERGIVVCHAPGANAPAVAEFVLTSILLLLKPVLAGRAWLRAGPPVEGALVVAAQRAGLVGRELAGVTVGVVGWGDIGRRVGGAVRALGGRVVAYDPLLTGDIAKPGGPDIAASLDALLERADVVTLHVPLMPETRGLIGARELALMPPGAALVNAARGGVVDEAALADAIRGGHLSGAAVDVFVDEPPGVDHPLLRLDGVVCTPHVAGSTGEALERMAQAAVDAVLAVLDGDVPVAVANPEVLGRR
jgi:D-3-phosphoglycerate dehydrogenase